MFERGGVAGDVLVLADSTIAYGVDRWRHASWRIMGRDLARACPSVSSVWFCAYSGATIDGLTQYAKESLAGWDDTYDFVVVVAGWNSNGVGDGEIRAQLSHLRDFIGQRIRPVGDESARGIFRGTCPSGSADRVTSEGGSSGERDMASGGVKIELPRIIETHEDGIRAGAAGNDAPNLGGRAAESTRR